jgi:AcrR family transcriptional regulator
MRTIAKQVGISAAALYHHYPDKQSLYLATMERAFADKSEGITSAVAKPGSGSDRLYAFVESFTQLMAGDPDFRALFQRELLDGDDERLKLLADKVFGKAFKSVGELAQELAPDIDPHMLVISMAGLVLFHFETAPVRRFLPGGKAKHNKVNVIVDHVYSLLSKMLVHD